MQPFHYENFGKKINIKVKYTDKYNKDEVNFLTCDNPYFQIIHKSINRCTSIEDEYDLNEHNGKDIKWATLKYINDNLKNYKEVKNCDFQGWYEGLSPIEQTAWDVKFEEKQENDR